MKQAYEDIGGTMTHYSPPDGARPNRRLSARFPVRVRVRIFASAAFLDADADVGGAPLLELYGHTSDLSHSGAAVILPVIHFDPRSCGQGRELKVTLEFAHSNVEVVAEAVHGDSLYLGENKEGFRIGLRFSELSERAHSLIASHLPKWPARDRALT